MPHICACHTKPGPRLPSALVIIFSLQFEVWKIMFFELQLITLLTVAVKLHIIYRPFALFRLDSKIIHFLHVFVGVTSLYADKSVHFMQSSTKKKIFFSYSMKFIC